MRNGGGGRTVSVLEITEPSTVTAILKKSQIEFETRGKRNLPSRSSHLEREQS